MALAIPVNDVSESANFTVSGVFVPAWVMVMVRVLSVVVPVAAQYCWQYWMTSVLALSPPDLR
jgi:hypothetical protein